MEFCRTELAERLGGEVVGGQVIVTHEGRKIHITEFDGEGKPVLTSLGKRLATQTQEAAEAPAPAPAPAPVAAKKTARARKEAAAPAPAPAEPETPAAPQAPSESEQPAAPTHGEMSFDDLDLSDIDTDD